MLDLKNLLIGFSCKEKKKIKTEREREREKPIIKPHAYDKLCHAMEDRETVGGFGLMRF